MRSLPLSGILMAALLASCTSPQQQQQTVSIAAPAADQNPRVTFRDKNATAMVPVEAGRIIVRGTREQGEWRGGFGAYLRVLSETSCPAGTMTTRGETIPISAASVPLQPLRPTRTKVGDLTFVAGFHLTSTDKRFGGLSGLDVLEDGSLLAVSDNDSFIWIDLAKDGVTPVSARVAPMHNHTNRQLVGEDDGTAEGVAWNNGVALVSFDNNHQVLAYDIGKCGAAARGSPIVFGPFGLPLVEAYGESRISVNDNAGSDALGVTNDWYLFTGIETKIGQLSPMSARPIEQDPDFSLRVGVEAQEFVGLDVIPDQKKNVGAVRAFTLHRSFSPRSGYGVTIAETDFNRYSDDGMLTRRIDGEIDRRARYRYVETGWRKLAEIDQLMTIDNFEGLAAKELVDGRTRLFIVSDDNFSGTQRTLLMVFDLAKPMR